MGEDVIVPLVALPTMLIGLPWLILHYVTKWKQAPRITHEDEKMLDEMFHLARRLEERVQTVERLVALDHPDYRAGLGATPPASAVYSSSPTPVGYDLSRRS